MVARSGRTVAREEIGVLLVEDDEGDARLVEDELAERLPRARISRSRTLKEALSALTSRVDCVLLDLGLPDTSGLDAVARLRAESPGIPLIVLTGLADEAAGVEAVEAGAQDYLVKGHVDGDHLSRSIRYAIGRRQAEETERRLLLAEAQAREVVRLERGLAPKPLIKDSSVWVASCYRAGRSRALLGGDFFDVVQTADEALHIVVGDVCGHGPDEAAIGVSLRAAWRALVLAGEQPDVVLSTLQRLFEGERHLPGLFATLCTLKIERAQRSASMIRAGHPRPVLIEGTSISGLSHGNGSTGIGIGDGQWFAEQVPLPAGWTILLYTDGIIEGRIGHGPERLGEEGLHRLIAERIAQRPDWRDRPDSLLDELIADAERLNGDALSDDVAMLLIGVPADSERG
ncbi:MAG TPA: SpoIIE family protein phosphatase [Solirubrobacteraceae bacterium]|nr:SpoIIE family protein phosphatase [Solirubrobacteraceae bacterium]